MFKVIILISSLLIISSVFFNFASAERENADAQELLSEVDKIDNSLNKQLYEHILSRQSKRSDIDARLMELQAKIDLVKAFQNLPPGHGKFNFEEIGKRYIDPMRYMKLIDQNKK